jgi:hypothetical protein
MARPPGRRSSREPMARPPTVESTLGTSAQLRRDIVSAIADPSMGATRSGRSISSGPVVPDCEGWTPEDHADAAEAHADAATDARYGARSHDVVAYDRASYAPKPSSERGHARMAEYHRRKSAVLSRRR